MANDAVAISNSGWRESVSVACAMLPSGEGGSSRPARYCFSSAPRALYSNSPAGPQRYNLSWKRAALEKTAGALIHSKPGLAPGSTLCTVKRMYFSAATCSLAPRNACIARQYTAPAATTSRAGIRRRVPRQRRLLEELTLVVWGLAAELSDYVPQHRVQQPKNLSPGSIVSETATPQL